jgi:hypothetical protein
MHVGHGSTPQATVVTHVWKKEFDFAVPQAPMDITYRKLVQSSMTFIDLISEQIIIYVTACEALILGF